ncbi:MAG TPA: 16S rRNA (cytidine(1402)-2'-O)-methyltransferase [Micropruina sp.]|jgi:16S rRNA (cytidine1402-2'-O)-methyltransferase|nr:16S rRNA (cytidine(1402)-2'-O)-methyltransferase [Micropruina sp.]
MGEPGVLVLAGTPIGHSEDASPALLEALIGADVIAAEDTRRFRDLCRRLGIAPQASVVSFFDGNESARVEPLLDHLRDGRRVVVVSDAGMPAVSDPGYRLVAAAADEGLRVTAVPGPSAVLTALAVSGLPTDRFCFEGFLPRKGGERRGRLAALAAEPRTMVFFEAPHRVAAFLADAADALGGQRRAVACRELTKTHEEVRRGTLGDLVVWAEGEVRGELTLVIEGAQVGGSLPDALAAVQAAVEGGGRLSEAVAEVAAAHGVSRRELYDAALKQRAGR